MHNHVYLIGAMAAGKTTVGRKLARLLRCEFIDTDHALEQRTGVSIGHIFEIEGESGFREREAKLLGEIAARVECGADLGAVVATGGGVILRRDNRETMRATGTVVYLRASLELLWRRLRNNAGDRPLLNTPDPKGAIAKLLDQRGPLYAAEADFSIDIRAESAARVARDLHDLLQSRAPADSDSAAR
ncbi:MAG: shikimate kinase [bacterium]